MAKAKQQVQQVQQVKKSKKVKRVVHESKVKVQMDTAGKVFETFKGDNLPPDPRSFGNDQDGRKQYRSAKQSYDSKWKKHAQCGKLDTTLGGALANMLEVSKKKASYILKGDFPEGIKINVTEGTVEGKNL